MQCFILKICLAVNNAARVLLNPHSQLAELAVCISYQHSPPATKRLFSLKAFNIFRIVYLFMQVRSLLG